MQSLIITTDKKKALMVSEDGKSQRTRSPRTGILPTSSKMNDLEFNKNKEGNVKVCIKVRPLNSREKA